MIKQKKILFVQANSRESGIPSVHKKLGYYFAKDGYNISFLTFVKNTETDDYVNCLGLSRLSIIGYLKSFILIKRFLRSERPDIVIAGSELICAPMSFWKRKFKYFLLINQHIDIESFLKNCSIPKRILYLFARNLNRHADIIANCSQAATNTTNRYYKTDKCITLYNPVDDFLTVPVSDPDSIFETNKVIVACGNLCKRKNYSLMLQGFALAKKELNFPVKLVILGLDAENLLCELKTMTENLGIDNEVIFKGGVQNPRDYMYFSEFLLHTSLFEGLPLVFVEALSTGIPIVTNDFKPGAREILGNNNEYGRLIKYYTPNAVAEAIVEQMSSQKK